VSTTAPKRTCRHAGCTEPATKWAPVWARFILDDDYRERWGERPFCAEHAEAARAAAMRRRLDDLFGPIPRMRGWSFESFPSGDDVGAAAKARALRWLEEEMPEELSPRLIIFGPVGSGKTSLALSCLRRWIERSHGWDDVAFVNVRELFAETRRSYGRKAAADPTAPVRDAILLALDDVGSERATPWAVEQLATIIDERYVADRPTIVTSNYAPSELAQRLGHDDPVIGLRIVSRLTENAVQIRLHRPDLRTRNAASAADERRRS
jgi:DNA replication protein DnaC